MNEKSIQDIFHVYDDDDPLLTVQSRFCKLNFKVFHFTIYTFTNAGTHSIKYNYHVDTLLQMYDNDRSKVTAALTLLYQTLNDFKKHDTITISHNTYQTQYISRIEYDFTT